MNILGYNYYILEYSSEFRITIQGLGEIQHMCPFYSFKCELEGSIINVNTAVSYGNNFVR